MKRIIVAVAAVAFGAALFSAPTAALSVPGNTCNPPAGHGRSGCHRVTTTPVAKRRVATKRVARKHVTPKRIVRKLSVAPRVVAKHVVTAKPAVMPNRIVGPPAAATPAPRVSPHVPWWVAIWTWFVK